MKPNSHIYQIKPKKPCKGHIVSKITEKVVKFPFFDKFRVFKLEQFQRNQVFLTSKIFFCTDLD